jgi:hypothetical protein
MRRRSPAVCQCRPPLAQRLEQYAHPNPPQLHRTGRQILARSLHQRTGPCDIPGRMMMKRDRRLDEPLQKSLLRPLRFPPHVLPNLMRVVELARIEEPNPPLIAVDVGRHTLGRWKLVSRHTLRILPPKAGMIVGWNGHCCPPPWFLSLLVVNPAMDSGVRWDDFKVSELYFTWKTVEQNQTDSNRDAVERHQADAWEQGNEMPSRSGETWRAARPAPRFASFGIGD